MIVHSKNLRPRRRYQARCLLLLFFAIVGGMHLSVIWLTASDANWKMPLGFPASEYLFERTRGSSGSSVTPNNDKKKRYAYAFYATTPAYACGAFVQVAQLRDLGTPASVEFVILTYGEASTNPGIIEQASKMDIILKGVEHLPILGANTGNGSRRQKDRTATAVHNTYYTNVMVKLRVFQLYEYDRVVYMDTDMMVRQNLDHLFFSFPSGFQLAAAKVTNRKNTDPQRFCSCFMVLEPSVQLWKNRIMKYFEKKYFEKNQSSSSTPIMYDMDLLNLEFRSDVTLLPGSYGMLTAIWDNNNRNSTTNQSIAVDATEDDGTREWYQTILQGPSKLPSRPNQGDVKSRQDLFQESLVLHFTPNKPMVERNLANMQRSQPHADPQYYATFEKWYSLASYVCPFDGQLSKVHKYDKHRSSKFEQSHQYSDYFY